MGAPISATRCRTLLVVLAAAAAVTTFPATAGAMPWAATGIPAPP